MRAQKLSREEGARRGEKVLLLDAPSLIYRAYHALPSLTAASGEPAGGLYGFLSILLRVLKDRQPTFVAAAMDLPGKTFRHEAYGAYKATRPPVPDDLVVQLRRSREALEALGVPILAAEGYEADDAIATAVRHIRRARPDVRIEIVSGDADLLQLVDERTTVLAPKRGVTDLTVLTEEGVQEKLGVPPTLVAAFKALRGDPSDNIAGVRGIGEKTAAVLLRYAGSLESLLARAERPPADAPKEFHRFAPRIRERADAILASRDLVTLRSDAPISFTLEAARFRGPTPGFLEALKRFGFESLLARSASLSERSRQKRAPIRSPFPDTRTLEAFIAEQEAEVRREIDAAEDAGTFSREIAALERRLIPVISAMERRGILVDRDALSELSERFRARQEELREEIFRIAGHPFNLASPKQLAEVLFRELRIVSGRRTAGGQRSTAAAVLEDLRTEHPIIERILAWREITKLLSTYVETLPKLIDPADGRIHAKFWQLGTVTGRIASSEPNLQNIPARSEDGRAVRNVFIAPRTSVLLAADYSQIELRVAAVLSGDPVLREIFRRGEDVHEAIAQKVFGVAADAVTPAMRRRAKVLNFGVLYGMGPRRVSREMGVPLGEAQAFIEEYFATFPTLRSWMDRIVAQARRDGFTETVFGRKRLFPEFSAAQEHVRSAAERAAVNAPIQGTAADLVKRGMVAMAREIPEAAMIAQVHDEILVEVSSSRIEHVAAEIRSTLEAVWPEAGIPFPVRISVGERWGALANLALPAQ